MEEHSGGSMMCDVCNADAVDGVNYCPNCGALYEGGVQCAKHTNVAAIGVCVLCGTAGCAECCQRGDWAFLCTDHGGYEIMEGHALVYSTFSRPQSLNILTLLEQSGFHPFEDIGTYKSSSEPVGPKTLPFSTRNRSMFRVFMPFEEVGGAQKILEEMHLEIS